MDKMFSQRKALTRIVSFPCFFIYYYAGLLIAWMTQLQAKLRYLLRNTLVHDKNRKLIEAGIPNNAYAAKSFGCTKRKREKMQAAQLCLTYSIRIHLLLESLPKF